MKMLLLYYHELSIMIYKFCIIINIKDLRTWKKKIFDGWWLSAEVLDKIKILIDADDKLPDITLKNVVILMTCVIKDGNKFHS